jgi:hypothetical protein
MTSKKNLIFLSISFFCFIAFSCGKDNTSQLDKLEKETEKLKQEIEFLKNNTTQIDKLEQELDALKKEIKADIDKMIKGTVYITSSVLLQDSKWSDLFENIIGSGVVYKGYIITNRHVAEPYSILEDTTGFYSCPLTKCQDLQRTLNWYRLQRSCYLDDDCYKSRVIFRSCMYMFFLYYSKGNLNINDITTYPCRVLWEKILQDYAAGKNKNCINDFFQQNFEFEDMSCYKIYSSYLPEVRVKTKAYAYDGTELDVANSKFPSCRDMDLARLEVNKNISQFNLSNADKFNVGDRVFAVGQPLGLGWTISAGIVSAKRNVRDLYKLFLPPIYYEIFEPTCDYNIVQTDTQINSGNSGGGLFDTKGNLIGINTWKIAGSEGISFAINFSEVENNLFK